MKPSLPPYHLSIESVLSALHSTSAIITEFCEVNYGVIPFGDSFVCPEDTPQVVRDLYRFGISLIKVFVPSIYTLNYSYPGVEEITHPSVIARELVQFDIKEIEKLLPYQDESLYSSIQKHLLTLIESTQKNIEILKYLQRIPKTD